MRAKGTRIAAIVTAAAATAAISVPVASGDGGAKTQIKMTKLSATGAAGKVSSGRASCLKNRKISLFIKEDFITDKLAITYTNSKGEWRVKKSLKEGVYFAKVDASKGCRYDNSKRKRLTIG